MIPKVIHYCWFGRNPKSKSVIKCINSWKKYCPDYEIIEWNEDNFPININLYCEQAYVSKKWAFVSDYARLWIIYNYGGIYLDTDVELIKNWDNLLRHDCFFGRQFGFQVNTGSGFGAIKGNKIIKKMMDDYENIPFIKEDGQYDLLTCPHRNSQCLYELGLNNSDTFQLIENVAIYPIEYFCPLDAFSRELIITNNTYSIHHCDASWNPNETKLIHIKRHIIFIIKREIDRFIHLPNLFLMKILGIDRYTIFKYKIKRRMKGVDENHE